MKIEDLTAKAQKHYMEHCYYCKELLKEIKHILPNKPYLGFDIFMQTDGLCLTDINFKNYPVCYIIQKFKEKIRD